MMRNKIKSVEIKGFKSIRDQCVELGDLNVLIGANGSGKSNLVSYFKMLDSIMQNTLQLYVEINEGGANAVLHYGVKNTRNIESKIVIETQNALVSHYINLIYTANDNLVTIEEETTYLNHERPREPELVVDYIEEMELNTIRDSLNKIGIFQFQDTSKTARIKTTNKIHDNRYLYNEAGNLAAVLYMLRETKGKYYKRIVSTIQQVAPFFGDFDVSPLKLNPQTNMLNWREKGSNELFGPHQLSDGTLRFMALVTLLMQPPEDLPDVVIIDEPELGLHPLAITILSELLQCASQKCQIIISTQSVELLNFMEPGDIIVVDRPDKESLFSRLDEKKLKDWLEDYSLGELWKKNVLGGRPA